MNKSGWKRGPEKVSQSTAVLRGQGEAEDSAQKPGNLRFSGAEQLMGDRAD